MQTLIYIDDSYCESLIQLKDYVAKCPFNEVIYNDILALGRSGDIAKWLEEHNETHMCHKVAAINKNLGDTDYINELSEILIGTSDIVRKQPFDKSFKIENVGYELGSESVEVSLSLKPLCCINENYEVSVSCNWGNCVMNFNPSDYGEGKVITKKQIIHRVSDKIWDGIKVKVDGIKINVHRKVFVDLGLSVCWADCNIGASSPEEYGGYYYFGQTEEGDVYEYKSGKYAEQSISGTLFDVARVKWGGDWHLPTKEDFEELCLKCIWQKDTVKGVVGYRVTGPNGNCIFLPAGGQSNDGNIAGEGDCCLYWSGTLSINSDYHAYYLNAFDRKRRKVDWRACSYGHNIRPVCLQKKSCAKNESLNNFTISEQNVCSSVVDLGLSVYWASCNVGASKQEEYGKFYAWGEVEEKAKYTYNSYRYSHEVIGDDICGTQYDVAKIMLGGKWRMPTEKEFEELIKKCEFRTCEINGIYGHRVIGPNGNSIFLPAGGDIRNKRKDNTCDCEYWTGTRNCLSYPSILTIITLGGNSDAYLSAIEPYKGLLVRPVYDK